MRQRNVSIAKIDFAEKASDQRRAAVLPRKFHGAFEFVTVGNIPARHVHDPRQIRRFHSHFQSRPDDAKNVEQRDVCVFKQRLKLLAVASTPVAWIQPSKPESQTLHACFSLLKPVLTIWLNPESCSSR